MDTDKKNNSFIDSILGLSEFDFSSMVENKYLSVQVVTLLESLT